MCAAKKNDSKAHTFRVGKLGKRGQDRKKKGEDSV